MEKRGEMLLWLSDARGRYIPRDFASSFADRSKSVSGVSEKDWEILEEGPDHEWYWEAWIKVCDYATVTDDKGIKYFVYQDGDCWLIPIGMEWLVDGDFFQWPREEEDWLNEEKEEIDDND